MESNLESGQQQNQASNWDSDDDFKPKKKAESSTKVKVYNGRYLKIKKIGEGTFNNVYLTQDLIPDGKRRVLSENHQQMVDQIPSSYSNPYKKASYSFYDDYDDDSTSKKQEVDPKILAELRNLTVLLPENDMFLGQTDQPI